MDVNIVFECIGYGASRAVTSERFPRLKSRIPARFILTTAKDPVAYCVDAYMRARPGCAIEIDSEMRTAILARLKREAGLSTH